MCLSNFFFFFEVGQKDLKFIGIKTTIQLKQGTDTLGLLSGEATTAQRRKCFRVSLPIIGGLGF